MKRAPVWRTVHYPVMTRHLVLAGAGHAQLHVLQALAHRRPHAPHGSSRLTVTLVSPSRWQHYSGMLPGWMTGAYTLADCRIDVRPLAEAAGARFLEDRVTALDATRRQLTLASGATLDYDLLSLDVGSEIDAGWAAPLGPRLLPIKPLDAFANAWQALLAEATVQHPPQHKSLHGSRPGWQLAVAGGGAAGVEAALAAAVALRAVPSARLWLVTGRQGVLPGHPAAVRRHALQALAHAGVAVCAQHALGTPEGLRLGDGSMLSVDRVIAATGARAPAWLARAGTGSIQCDAAGFVQVGPTHQSVSHPEVFAAGDVCARVDRALPRSGVHAVRAGPVVAHNLLRSLAGQPLAEYRPRQWSLYLLATGDGRAIASWGPLSAEGRWVWRLKDHIDRGFMARFASKNVRSIA